MDNGRKLALVTGASRGFGRAVADALARASWDVVALVRTATEFNDPRRVSTIVGDVTQDLSDTLGSCLSSRPLDLLVNNAGIGAKGQTLATTSADEVAAMLDVHVLGALRVTQTVLPNLQLARRPLVMNISSRLAPMTRQAKGDFEHLNSSYGYRIAKAAQNMLTICMAQELRASSVRVWAVHPGRLQSGQRLRTESPQSHGTRGRPLKRAVA